MSEAKSNIIFKNSIINNNLILNLLSFFKLLIKHCIISFLELFSKYLYKIGKHRVLKNAKNNIL